MEQQTITQSSSGSSGMGENANIELTVVMPCLNEAETLAICIEKALKSFIELGIVGEVVIADNGSTDGSQEIAQKLGARVVPVAAKGYGSALQGGIAAAYGKYVIMGDADDSYDFSHLEFFVAKLREGHDLVLGNRFRGGIQPGAMPPLHQYLGNPVLSALSRLFFHAPTGDIYCGLRGFTKAAITKLDLRTTGMEYANEMVVKATLYGLNITEVPTKLWPDGRSRRPHLRTWRDGWRTLRFLLLYSPRWLFLYPGMLLILAGLGVGLWLVPGTRAVGNVKLDVQTLLYAAMATVIGFQAVFFAVHTKLFAISEGLLPEDSRLNKMFQYVTLETGLLFGGLLLLSGLAGSIYAFTNWGSHGFGPENTTHTLRLVIPSVTALTLGSQIVLSSFFLSVLGMKRK